MKRFCYLIACLFALLLTGCSANLTRSDAAPWLDLRSGSGDYDISGRWDSGSSWSGSWGEANFIQDGARFYGQLGSYNVEGALNGNAMYLSLSAGKRVYYTALLKRDAEGGYSGKVVQDTFVDGPLGDSVSYQVLFLRRKEAPTSPAPKPGANGPARAQ
ncbi:MAG: hypothetical protein D3M94_00985 [Rhodocyclales bacterium GT-UBC]|nr:MAG: hypothetical protein D3M94_00985 [Rhodocyclales bacterium GT-UBC]